MERFNLTKVDLMTMSWTELTMMFDAVFDEDEDRSPKEEVRYATEQDWKNWL